MTDLPTAAVCREIQNLHAFFVAWFSGSCEPSDRIFASEFSGHFDAEFVLIPPSGRPMDLDSLAQSIRPMHGSNPQFRIAIRNVEVRRRWPGHVLATYEEWQRNALASTPPDNGRIATVVFGTAGRPSWLHVHETWLPEPIMAAGPYDF